MRSMIEKNIMKIVVLAGGISTEREVSIVSGTQVCRALRSRGHQAILVDVYCGAREADVDTAFAMEYDLENAVEYIIGGDEGTKGIFRTECAGIMQSGGHCVYGAPWRKRRKWKDTGDV